MASHEASVAGSSLWLRPKSCRLCREQFASAALLVDHFSVAHGDPPHGRPLFVCHFCFAGFGHLREFSFHVLLEELRVAAAGGFACRVCGDDSQVLSLIEVL